jgi:hypothetical protein
MKDINRVLEGLDTSFDAAVAASDDEAANDLAYSLSQGFTLTHALSRWPGVTWHIGNGIVVSAEEIAADHVVALGGTLVAPLNRLVATRSEGPPVRFTQVGAGVGDGSGYGCRGRGVGGVLDPGS